LYFAEAKVPPPIEDRDSGLDADQIAELRRLLAPGSRGPVDALYAAVYANPADDAPRQVLADALQEQGDPRGEFIALQLAAANGKPTTAQRKRIKELFAQHGAQWLGALAPAFNKTGTEFERGFLARIALNGEHRAELAAAIGNPVLSTVYRVECSVIGTGDVQYELLIHPVMKSLKEVTEGPRALLRLERELPIESLETSGPTEVLARCRSLPRLRELRFSFDYNQHSPSQHPGLFDSPLLRQLERLALDTELTPEWCDALARLGARVQVVEFEPRYSAWSCAIARRAGVFDDCTITVDPKKLRASYIQNVRPKLSRVIRRVTV
jgi:uncharacterized protein (TIGR02996 family)